MTYRTAINEGQTAKGRSYSGMVNVIVFKEGAISEAADFCFVNFNCKTFFGLSFHGLKKKIKKKILFF